MHHHVRPATRGECGHVGCSTTADFETSTRVTMNTWSMRLYCFDHAPLHVLAAAGEAAKRVTGTRTFAKAYATCVLAAAEAEAEKIGAAARAEEEDFAAYWSEAEEGCGS